VSSTEYDIPIKLLEAWALGVPMIITKHAIKFSRSSSIDLTVWSTPV
jgi:hypothetical protein